ncbi:MAG TPA: 2-hydroxychromene-2-carboxylate isomerase [Burkholderiaceae bacterium]|jgi:2-hydroxychromene-2-carboxylate isomerase|nr:2-hydroxychromene-2-carboxylate isomerase [Burkholderiaceae bacterium]
MPDPIDFYFDFSSPYGYFAAMRIDELAAKYGRTVDWHPILLGVIFKTTGGMPLPQVPVKGQYSLRDFDRTARFHGIPFRFPPIFPIATQATARAMLWIRETAGGAKAAEFAKAAYGAYFVDGINVGDPANVAQLAFGLGLDPAALTEAINRDEIKNRLRADVEQALARGVFGSPYIVVDGEPFWGFDRFDQVEALLKNGQI